MTDPTVVPFPHGTATPVDLSAAELELWRAIIASRKAGFFGPEVFPLIASYCTTATMCEHIAARLRVEQGVDHEMLETYDRMTRSLSSLAEALGLLPGQSKAF
jgi:hypothetical protein